RMSLVVEVIALESRQDRNDVADIDRLLITVRHHLVLLVGNRLRVRSLGERLLELVELTTEIHQALIAHLIGSVPSIDELRNVFRLETLEDLQTDILRGFERIALFQKNVVGMATIEKPVKHGIPEANRDLAILVVELNRFDRQDDAAIHESEKIR